MFRSLPKFNTDELMLLFLAARLRSHAEFILKLYQLKKEAEIDPYLSGLKVSRPELMTQPLADPGLLQSFDNHLLFLCKHGHRNLAEALVNRIKHRDDHESLLYVERLVKNYQLEKDSSARKLSEKIWLILKNGFGITWLIYLTCKLWHIHELYPAAVTKSTNAVTGWLYQQLIGLVSDLHPSVGHVFWFILILFISYLLKSVIGIIILFSGDDEYSFGTYSSEWKMDNLFFILCLAECVAFGLLFGLHGWWWAIKTCFFLEVSSIVGAFLLFETN